MTQIKTKIPAELEPAAVGGKVTDAKYIIDRVKNKTQKEINADTEERVSTLEESVGTGGSVDERIAEEGAKHYLKTETYSKTELNNMITTPSQEYVSVTATDQTTAVTDVLPATGEADTVYRVGNWDGSQYDTTCYTEYAWNGSAYVKLNTKKYGIDDEPTDGSDNLVTSNGISQALNNVIGEIPLTLKKECYYYNNQVYFADNNNYRSAILPIVEGDNIRAYCKLPNTTMSLAISFWSDEPSTGGAYISGVKADSSTVNVVALYSAVAPANSKYAVVSSLNADGILAISPSKLNLVDTNERISKLGYNIVYNGYIQIFEDFKILIGTSSDGVKIYDKNGLIKSYPISTGAVLDLSADNCRLVFDTADSLFKVMSYNETLVDTQYVLLKRGIGNTNNFHGFTEGYWLPIVIKQNSVNEKGVEDANSRKFLNTIEAFEANDRKYVNVNSYYKGEIRKCSPNDIVKVYSKLTNNGYSYAISFWSKVPIPNLTSVPQEEPSGFLSGVKADADKSNILSYYEATAPADTAYVVVSSLNVDDARFADSLNDKVEKIDERLRSVEVATSDLIRFPKTTPHKPLIAFSMDFNGNDCNELDYIGLLSSYGINDCTFYPVLDLMSNATFLSKLNYLKSKGYEIGLHGSDTTITKSVIVSWLNTFKEKGFAPRSVLPANASSTAEMRQLFGSFFNTCLKTDYTNKDIDPDYDWSNVYNDINTKRYEFNRISLDVNVAAHTTENVAIFVQQIKDVIDHCIETGTYIIFYCHKYEGYVYNSTYEDIVEPIAQYIKSKVDNYECKTGSVSDVIENYISTYSN